MSQMNVLLRLGSDQLAGVNDPEGAFTAIQQAVSELAGVGEVRVERAEEAAGDGSDWIRLAPPGGAEAPADGNSGPLRERVRAAVLVTLAAAKLGLDSSRTADVGTAATAGGFSDARGYRVEEGELRAAEEIGTPVPAAPDVAAPPARPVMDDQALLSRLLELVNPHADPGPLARGALRRFGSFAAVLSAPVRDLRAVPGLGTHSVAAVKLVHEAALRLARAGVMHRPVLDNWPRLIDYLAAQLGREKIEQFRVLFLDERDRLLADEAQARGTVNHTPVYPREVVRRAMELQAASVILVHNHPSGDPTPSREDLTMTAQVSEAAAVLSITLRDHVIVGNGRWVSFRQDGLL